MQPLRSRVLIEHFTLWPPLHCGEERRAAVPATPSGDASRPIVTADSPKCRWCRYGDAACVRSRGSEGPPLELGVDDDDEEDLFDGGGLPEGLPASARRSRGGPSSSRGSLRIRKTVAVQRLSGMRFESRRSVRLRRRLPTSKAPCSRWRMRLRSQLGQATRQHPAAAAAVGAARHRQDPCRQAPRSRHRSAIPLLSMNLSPAFGQIGGLDLAWRGARPGKVAQALIETGPPRR